METPTLSVAEERCKGEFFSQREPGVAQRVSLKAELGLASPASCRDTLIYSLPQIPGTD